MAKAKVTITVDGISASQKEFDADMVTVRKALSILEESKKKSTSERLRIVGMAQKGSTVLRIGAMKKRQKKQNPVGVVTVKG